MKRCFTPTNLFFLLLFFVNFCFFDINAQSVSDRAAVKKWLIENKDNVTLVTSKEYHSMSPSIKDVLSSDAKTIIYNNEVKVSDIMAFQDKNIAGNFVPFKKEQLNENLVNTELKQIYEDRVLKWLENESSGIKIISYLDYMSRPISVRAQIDNLDKKIIYFGNRITWDDIESYNQK
ncbi:MAG: hypothetical protein MK207_02245 [Saprospiraceae bacterium]|nr:hypothetical protein [Saprospiraceae bacterium]